MVFNFLATLLFAVTFLSPESPRGTIPRSAATDYAAHASQDNIQIGASLLTHKELKKIFATDVNQCCLVVEVAFYPPKNNFVKISLDDFMLREPGMELGTRPSSPEVLAARLEVQPARPDSEHRPGVTSGSDIGYERTTQQNGPERTSSGGVVQRSRVGIGVPIGGGGGGSKLPEGRTAEGNHRAIEAELREKGLPEADSWDPVAGYLYFSVPKKKKGGYELVYMAGEKKVVLPLK
ncbi:MAG: hypothetical protein JWM83_2672 [Candidatus Angelobacter sp.]|nr:hypothetical protein [Candidatus Angelobacter sp.]